MKHTIITLALLATGLLQAADPITLTIDPAQTRGLEAIIAKMNAETAAKAAEAVPPQPAFVISAKAYLQSRVAEMLASYDQQLVEQAKKDYDYFVTLAASLPDDKKAMAVDYVQRLAAEAAASPAQ